MQDDLLAMVEYPDPQAIAEASITQFDLPQKTKYISFRVCGFTITEALRFAGITMRTRFNWRNNDPKFHIADDNAGLMKKDLADRYIEIEFRRNMRLVLQLDFEVLKKCTEKAPSLSPREQSWLNRLRQHYTPQQMEAMARALSDGGDGKDFDFTKFILGMAKGSDKFVMAGSRE